MENKIETSAGGNQPAELAVAAPAAAPSQLPKYLTILGALVIVCTTAVALYSLQLTKQAAKSVSDFFSPKEKYSTVLSGAIGALNNKAKLEVLSAEITATSGITSTGTIFGVAYSTATDEVTAPAKVRYYVELDAIKMDDFYYDKLGKRMVITIPRPILDRNFVSIDPATIQRKTELGWSPLSVFKAEHAHELAVANLKEAVLQQGSHELLQDRADKNAKESVSKLLSTVSEAMAADGVKVEVEFKKQ